MEIKGGRMMYCSNCGTKLPDGAKFCGSCGTRLRVPGDDSFRFSSAAKRMRETAGETVNSVENHVSGFAREHAEDFHLKERAKSAETKARSFFKTGIKGTAILIAVVFAFLVLISGGEEGTPEAKECAIESAALKCELAGYTVDAISAEYRASDRQSTGDMGEVYEVKVKTLERGVGTYLIAVVVGQNTAKAMLQYPRDGIFLYAGPDFEHTSYSEDDIYAFTHTLYFDPDEQ